MTATKIVKFRLDGEGSREKLPKLKESVVEQAVAIYEEPCFTGPNYYDMICEKIQGLDVTPSQLKEIAETLEKKHAADEYYPDLKLNKSKDYDVTAGYFLTALVNHSSETTFEFKTRCGLYGVGWKLKAGKELTVTGDLGNHVANEMEGGKLHVRGSVRDLLGNKMTGGEIIVEKNAGNYAGQCMGGGSIHIKGRAWEQTGQDMSDGKITVDGDVGSWLGAKMTGGYIRVKGNAGEDTGIWMESGEIEVDGKIAELSDKYFGGKIWGGGLQRR
ncbi:MAG: hypothetical protein V1921_06585 [Candidatus Altiarchaeota archaeon]